MFDGGGQILALAALFGAVFLAVFGAAGLIGAKDPIRRRLAGEAPHPAGPRRGGHKVSLRANAMWPGRGRLLLGPFDALLFNPQRRIGRFLRARLGQAGIADPLAPRAYVLAQALLAIAVPAAAIGLVPSLVTGVADWQAIGLVVALASGGCALPGLWLARRIARRRRESAESFPDALDMMVVCVEAGLGLDAALARVGTQMAPVHPLIAAELDRVTLELRAGKGRDEALRNFAARIALPEVASFVTLLIQSEALGASIAQTLRAHAEDMRAGRLLRAEEKAHTLPVKLTIPLVLCILPAMLVAVLLPGMLTIVRTVLPSLSQ